MKVQEIIDTCLQTDTELLDLMEKEHEDNCTKACVQLVTNGTGDALLDVSMKLTDWALSSQQKWHDVMEPFIKEVVNRSQAEAQKRVTKELGERMTNEELQEMIDEAA